LLKYLCDRALNGEKLTPYEIKELFNYLITLDETHRDAALQKGLISALDNRKVNCMKQVSSVLDMSKEEQKVKELNKENCKAAFEEIEAISRRFER
jgi:predicted GTPase